MPMTNKVDLIHEFSAHRDAAMMENEDRLNAGFDAALERLPDELRETWPEAAAVPRNELRWREIGIGHSAGGALAEIVWEIGNDTIGRRSYRLALSPDAKNWKWTQVTWSREKGYIADVETSSRSADSKLVVFGLNEIEWSDSTNDNNHVIVAVQGAAWALLCRADPTTYVTWPDMHDLEGQAWAPRVHPHIERAYAPPSPIMVRERSTIVPVVWKHDRSKVTCERCGEMVDALRR